MNFTFQRPCHGLGNLRVPVAICLLRLTSEPFPFPTVLAMWSFYHFLEPSKLICSFLFLCQDYLWGVRVGGEWWEGSLHTRLFSFLKVSANVDSTKGSFPTAPLLSITIIYQFSSSSLYLPVLYCTSSTMKATGWQGPYLCSSLFSGFYLCLAQSRLAYNKWSLKSE